MTAAKMLLHYSELPDWTPNDKTPFVENIVQQGSYSFVQSVNCISVPGYPSVLRKSPLVNNVALELLPCSSNENEYRALNCSLSKTAEVMLAACGQDVLVGKHFASDRNTLKLLFGFATGDHKMIDFSEETTVSIEADWKGETIIMARHRGLRQSDDQQTNDQLYYNQAFENLMTVCPLRLHNCQGSFRHIVSMRFGKFNLLVRYSPDAIEIDEAVLNNVAVVTNEELQDILIHSELKQFHIADSRSIKPVELTVQRLPSPKFPATKFCQVYFSAVEKLIIGYREQHVLREVVALDREQIRQKYENVYGKVDNTLFRLEFILNKINKHMNECWGKKRFTISASDPKTMYVENI